VSPSDVHQQREQLELALAAFETQRALLGDALVDAALAPLRARLAQLSAPLSASPDEQHPREERKHVTILFADLVGFTAIVDRLDPEDVRAILDTYFACWSQLLADHGGIVEKFIGDAVVAVFGLPSAREDDPVRAVHAAIAVRAAMADLNLRFERDYGLRLAMRVGISTGPVLARQPDSAAGQNFEVVGDTVNIAARLEQSAPPGGILIAHTTYRQVRGSFRLQSLAPLSVKGKPEPLQVYLVREALPPALRVLERGVEGVFTAMIGRDVELAQIVGAFGQAGCGGRSLSGARPAGVVAITVTGEAGIGKSRLLEEFDHWLDLLTQDVFYFRGRANPHGAQIPGELLRSVFALRFEILTSDSASAVREKFEHGVAQFLGAESLVQAHTLGAWLGYDFSGSPHLAGLQHNPKHLHEHALRALGELFAAAARSVPGARGPAGAVLLLDDVHWADDQSLDALGALAHLLASRSGTPFFILATARPDLFERRPSWGAQFPNHQRLDLPSLSPEDSRRLAQDILRKADAVPDALLGLIVQRAEGNPFYVEELIKMLIDTGVILTAHEPWVVNASTLETLDIPATLAGVLQTRIDALPRDEKRTLQRAAVIGRTFWDQALEFLARPVADAAASGARPIEPSLNALRARELIFLREPAAFAGTREYYFKHVLLRDVAYENVLRRERPAYHARAASWLVAIAERSGRADEYAAAIAEHYELAGETLAARDWYARAGRQAAAQAAHAEATHCLARAFELTPANDEAARYALLVVRERVHDVQGTRAAQAEDLSEMEPLAAARHPGDDAHSQAGAQRSAYVAMRRAHYLEMTSDFRGAGAAAQRATGLAQACGALESEATARLIWSRALLRQSDYAAARLHAEQSLAQARAAGLPMLEAEVLRALGNVAHQQGDQATARDCYEQSLRLKRANRDRRGESAALNNLGLVALELGDFSTAQTYFEQVLPLRLELDDRRGQGIALVNLGLATRLQARYDAAHAYLEQAMELAREIGDRWIESLVFDNLALEAHQIGDYPGAQRLYEQALRLKHEIGDRSGACLTQCNCGLLQLYLGDDARAHDDCERAVQDARAVGSHGLLGYALTLHGHVLAARGEQAAARAAYEEGLTLSREANSAAQIDETLAGLARLALACGDRSSAGVYVEELLPHLAPGALEGALEPFRVYLTACQVLRARGDSRAAALLAHAQACLHEQAARIDDPARRRAFLENVPAHRELLALDANP
jgi:class 3 adenylate cyclase/predicted ATPase